MKKLLLLLIIPCLCIAQQQTYVPDDYFEQALIELGYDNVLNDSVTTSIIDTITLLPISNKNISSLIGIGDFSALQTIRCSGNQLTELDLSNNFNLQALFCGGNQLTELNLDNNPSLRVLKCGNNAISQLDLSNNSLLIKLFCRNNFLINLNIKNGNNSIIDSLYTTNNPNLNCIKVNNINYLNTNFTFENNNLDPQHYFDSECGVSTLLGSRINTKSVLKKLDVLGRESTNKGFQLHIYDDGSVEKKYLIK